MTETAAGSRATDALGHTSSGSRALWERALASLPGGNTRTTVFHDPHPVYLVRGDGCRVTDADGVERIDFISNYTSLILGHCHPLVVEAVQEQATRLMSAAAPSELEIELAERLRERLPSVERIRFTNSGTEATMLALRAARAFTGRTVVAAFAGGYHGSHDAAASIPADVTLPPGAPGVPPALAGEIVVAPFNDLAATRAALEPRLDDLAAVVVEPVLGAGGVVPATDEFLHFLRELTREAGSLLVFDEIISFRVGYNGAQGRYGVAPDLTTLGKIIGGGLPIGAFGGRADVMALFDPRSPDAIGHGGTFNANPLSMAAGLATLEGLTADRYASLEALTGGLAGALEALFAELGLPGQVTRAGSLFNVHFTEHRIRNHGDVRAADTQRLHELHLGLLERGILFTPRGMGCLSTPMGTAEVDAFVEATRATLAR